jgi:hypothetical protein
MNEQQFVKSEYRAMALVDEDAEALLHKFETYRPPRIDKAAWILEMNKQP